MWCSSGAVIGRTFAANVIQAASDLDESTLRAELDKLVGGGLLFAKGVAPPRTTYTPKARIDSRTPPYPVDGEEEAAAVPSSSSERKLEQRFPEVAETQPELLARHFTEAGAAARAVDYWLKAGQQGASQLREHGGDWSSPARARGARGIAGNRPVAHAQELQFQVSLAVALMTARGYAHPDLESVHTRARALCERLGPLAPLFHVIWGNWALRLIRDELDEANRLAGELCELAEKRQDRGLQVEANFSVAITSLYRAEFARGRAACDRCRALEDPTAAIAHSAHTGQNVGMAYRCYAALSAWYLGLPEEAATRMRGAVEVRLPPLKHPVQPGLRAAPRRLAFLSVAR